MSTRLQDAQSRRAKVRSIQTELEKLVVDYTSRSKQPTLVTKLLFGIAYEALAVQTGSFLTARATADEICREVHVRYSLSSPCGILLVTNRG